VEIAGVDVEISSSMMEIGIFWRRITPSRYENSGGKYGAGVLRNLAHLRGS
jgi:hypothetical protein